METKDPKTHLTDEERQRVMAMINETSVAEVARKFEVALGTLKSLVSQFPGRKGTLRMIRDGLAAAKKPRGQASHASR